MTWFAFVGLLWQFATLIFLYHRLRNYPPRNTTDHAFLNAPFSILTAITLSDTLHTLFQSIDQTKNNDVVSINASILFLSLLTWAHLSSIGSNRPCGWTWLCCSPFSGLFSSQRLGLCFQHGLVRDNRDKDIIASFALEDLTIFVFHRTL